MHPLDSEADENQGLRKAIVLLTDGEDNYCGEDPGACLESDLGIDRSEACTLAKDGGHEVFVVAAMPPGDISSDLAQSLRDCSSEADYPAGNLRVHQQRGGQGPSRRLPEHRQSIAAGSQSALIGASSFRARGRFALSRGSPDHVQSGVKTEVVCRA